MATRFRFLAVVIAVCWPAVATVADENAEVPVGMVTRDYVDGNRQNWTATGPRPLRTAIWYPIDEAKTSETIFGGPPDKEVFSPVTVAPGAGLSGHRQRYPLVVLSHGTGGSAIMMMWLGKHLAAHGYIAAAVNHHGNTAAEKAMEPQGFLLYWERARDLSLVIDSVLADPLFRDKVDTDSIGAAGFSLGGFTVIELAGGRFNQRLYDQFCSSKNRDATCEGQLEFPEAPARFKALAQQDPIVQNSLMHSGDSYRDARVRAVFAIAPALGGGFSAADLRDVTAPVEIVVGAGDNVAPPKTNARRYGKLILGAKAIVLPGNVGHYTFLHECNAHGREVLPICRDGAGVDRATVHKTVQELALVFFNAKLRVAQR